MSHSPASSGGDGLLRACAVVLALVALGIALFPDWLMPLLRNQGFDATAPDSQQLLRSGRIALGILAGVLLLYVVGRPFLADWRSYRRRLELARSEGADATRVFSEIEGRSLALTILLTLFAFIAFAFLSRSELVDRLLAPDSLTDTTTAIFYVVAIVLALFEIARQWGATHRVGLQCWVLLPAIAMFVLIVGEELDWARAPVVVPGAGAEAGFAEEASPLQRIPIPVVTEGGTVTTRVYESEVLLRVAAALIGIALPLLMLAFPSFARWLWAVGIPLPSRIVQLGFAVVALLPSSRAFEGWFGHDNAVSELRELLFAGMCLVLIWQMVRSNVVDEPRPAALARL